MLTKLDANETRKGIRNRRQRAIGFRMSAAARCIVYRPMAVLAPVLAEHETGAFEPVLVTLCSSSSKQQPPDPSNRARHGNQNVSLESTMLKGFTAVQTSDQSYKSKQSKRDKQ